MASAQQKPKATSADKRNPNRRNGKAFGKNHDAQRPNPAPRGKTVLGYKREKVVKWAKENGISFTMQVEAMKEKRRLKRASAASQRIEVRRGNPAARCRQRCCNPA